MPDDEGKIAVRVLPEIATFDHDPENGTYGHLPECKPTRVEKGLPLWFVGGEMVTDPERVAQLEAIYEEQTPPELIYKGVQA